MSNSKIDKLKEKLFHRETAVDNDALWASLESHIPESKKRRVVPFWLLFGLVGMAVILTFWMTINGSSEGELELNDALEFTVAIGENLSEIDQTLIESPAILELKNKEIVSTEKVNKGTAPTTAKFSTKPISFKTTIKESNQLKTNNEEVTTLENNVLIENSFPLENQYPTQQEVEASSKLEPASTPVGKLNPMVSALPQVARMENKLFEIELIDDLGMIKPWETKFIKSYWIKSQLVAGLSNATYESSDVEGEVANAWNENVSTLPNIGMNLLVGADISRRWSVFTGLDYQRITSRTSIDRNSTTVANNTGTTKTIIDGSGSSITESGNLTTTTIAKYKAKWHTYNHIISVPIGVEYYLFNHNKINVKLILGANIKIADFQKGSVLTESLTIEKFDIKNSPYQVTPFSFYLGSEVEYFLTEKLSIGVGMGIRSNQNTISVHDKIITERLRSLNSSFSVKQFF